MSLNRSPEIWSFTISLNDVWQRSSINRSQNIQQNLNEPSHGKTNTLYTRKQRRRSASLFSLQHLARFCDCTVWFVSDLVGNPNCWFSHAKAQLYVELSNKIASERTRML